MEILFRTRSELGAWRMAGAPSVEAWLAQRPWCGEGGVRRICVGDVASGDALADLLRRAVRAIDDRATEVRVAQVSAPDAHLDPARAAADALGAPLPEGHVQDRVRALARLIDHPPWVFIFDAATGLSSVAGADGLEELTDRFQKLPQPIAMTAIVLSTEPSAGADDFVHGAPWAPMPAEMSGLDWHWYLQHRIAWETAGRIDLATSWWPDALREGDEAGFEAALCEAARTRWGTVPAGARSALRRWRPDPRAAREEAQLLASGLLWRPAGLSCVRVTPWAARAMLDDGATEDALRTALTCVPITRELLARCIDLERRVRAHTPSAGPVREETEAIARRYQRQGSPERMHYAHAGAIPRDVRSYASLGEYLNALPLISPVRARLDELRALRNHLAHGHFAGWQTVRELFRLEASLR